MQGDEPLVNEETGKVDLVQDEAFTIDGFIAKDITTRELADTLLSKVRKFCFQSFD